MNLSIYVLGILIIFSILLIFILKDRLFYKYKKPELTLLKSNNINNIKSFNKEDIHINYFPYMQKPNILTEYELSFYIVLKDALTETNYIICPKIRLSDILVVYDTKEYIKYYENIAKRSIDFLLCDKDTFKPQIAIILDETNLSLNNPFFKQDELTLIFKSAAFKMIRFKKFKTYSSIEIKDGLEILY